MAGKMPNTERQLLPTGRQHRHNKQALRKRCPDDIKRPSGKFASRREDSFPVYTPFHQKVNGKVAFHGNYNKTRVNRGRGQAKIQSQDEDQEEELVDDQKESLREELINFRYERKKRETFDERRRLRKTYKPFQREAFVQANCNFVVREDQFHNKQCSDPDQRIDWKAVEQVFMKTLNEINCPICLYPPVAGKITRCGHIYCWPCITHYLLVDDKSMSYCPICFATIQFEDLKSVILLPLHKLVPGDEIVMSLMKRRKGSVLTMPKAKWDESVKDLVHWTGWKTDFIAKVHVASPRAIMENIINREKEELTQLLESEPEKKSDEIFYIQRSLEQLEDKKKDLLESMTEFSGNDVCQDSLSRSTLDFEIVDRNRCLQQNNNGSSPSSPDSTAGATAIAGAASASNKDESQEMVHQAKEFHYFYQANDGKDMFIHPVNVRCLIREYGALENCPVEIHAEIVDIETYTMTSELRKRFRYLSHLPLAREFSICEVLLKTPILSQDTIEEFRGEFQRRRKEREQKKKQEKRLEKKLEAKRTLDCFGRAISREMKKPVALNLASQEEFPIQFFSPTGDSPNVEKSICVSEVPVSDAFTQPSFSAALKTGKAKEMSSLMPSPGVIPSISSEDIGVRRQSESSDAVDEEDTEYTSIPSFCQAFSEALSSSFKELESEHGSSAATRKNKKGRQKTKKVLFTTGLTRISQ